jgi:imidazoleglycerol-phosphate dehydratase
LVGLDLDGTGTADISTGVGFYDHMLTTLARHSLIDLTVRTTGDLAVDTHHSVEDTAIALGKAIDEALGDKHGIRRFGHAVVPLDEALAACVVDVAGRPYSVCSGEPDAQSYVRIGPAATAYVGSMTQHVVQALAFNARICIHLRLLAGRDPHHIVEAQYKALARALRASIEPDPRISGVPSTKGSL